MTEEEDREALAAEYVLGTLDAEGRTRAETLVAADAEFAERVYGWERRLGELHAMVDPVEPPAQVWTHITARLAGVVPDGELRLPELPQSRLPVPLPTGWSDADTLIDLNRQLGHWRVAAIVAAGVAAVLAGLILAAVIAPSILPGRMREAPKIVEVPAPGGFVAALQRNGGLPGFILSVDLANRTFTSRRLVSRPAGKSFELWLQSDQYMKPRSLGLVDQEFTPARPLTDYDRSTITEALYAVTVEPEGGSPTGQPTGETVFQGKLVKIVPEPNLDFLR